MNLFILYWQYNNIPPKILVWFPTELEVLQLNLQCVSESMAAPNAPAASFSCPLAQ